MDTEYQETEDCLNDDEIDEEMPSARLNYNDKFKPKTDRALIKKRATPGTKEQEIPEPPSGMVKSMDNEPVPHFNKVLKERRIGNVCAITGGDIASMQSIMSENNIVKYAKKNLSVKELANRIQIQDNIQRSQSNQDLNPKKKKKKKAILF